MLPLVVLLTRTKTRTEEIPSNRKQIASPVPPSRNYLRPVDRVMTKDVLRSLCPIKTNCQTFHFPKMLYLSRVDTLRKNTTFNRVHLNNLFLMEFLSYLTNVIKCNILIERFLL